MEAGQDLTNGLKMLLPVCRVDDDIVQEDLAETTASDGVLEVAKNAVGQALEVRRPIGKAHAEPLILTKAKAACIEAGLMLVIRVEQHGVERALEVDGAEKFGVADLNDQVFCSGQRPTIFAGLSVDTAHVDAEADVTIFLLGRTTG